MWGTIDHEMAAMRAGLAVAGDLGGSEGGTLRDRLGIAPHGVEDESDGGVTQRDADSNSGGNSNEKRECDYQRIQGPTNLSFRAVSSHCG